MSLCYDFSKWTIVSMVSIAVSLTIGFVLQYAHGESSDLYECYTSFSHLYTSFNQYYSGNINMSDPITKQYIKNQCNFYHEKLGIWVDAMEGPPNSNVVGEFQSLYGDTAPESIKELSSMMGVK